MADSVAMIAMAISSSMSVNPLWLRKRSRVMIAGLPERRRPVHHLASGALAACVKCKRHTPAMTTQHVESQRFPAGNRQHGLVDF
jgi:hypothetical protein